MLRLKLLLSWLPRTHYATLRISKQQRLSVAELDFEIHQILDSKRTLKHLVEVDLIDKSFAMYQHLEDRRNQHIITLLIRLCSQSVVPERAFILLDDIKYLSKRRLIPLKSVINMSIGLLNCCLKSKSIRIDDCLHILQFVASMTDRLYLNLHGETITKFIKKSHDNLGALQYVDSLISKNYFIGDSNIITTALINGYGSCPQSEDAMDPLKAAHALFLSMNSLDIIAVGAMMKVFISHCQYTEALKLFDETGDSNNAITHTLAIKACKGCNDDIHRMRGHAMIQKVENRYSDDLLLKNTMIDFYGHFGDISSALRVFESIPNAMKTTSNINAVMTALTENGDYEYALRVYQQYESLQNEVTDLLALKAAKQTDRKNIGITIHHKIRNIKAIRNIQLLNGLVDFYGHFGDIGAAESILETMSDRQRDSASISSMMNVYLSNDRPHDALRIYKRYKHLGDTLCVTLAVKACSVLRDYENGCSIIMRNEDEKSEKLLESKKPEHVNIDLENTVIHFYGNCKEIGRAEERFNGIPFECRNTETITIMMEAFCKNDCYQQCVEMLFDLQEREVECPMLWYNIALKACTQGTLLRFGQDIHRYLECHEPNMLQQCSLIINLLNMYGKCAMVDICGQIFEGVRERKDVSIFNAMIHVYGRNGQLKEAMELFECIGNDDKMVPDRKTFILLINGCSHCGDMETARDMWGRIGDEDIKMDEYVMTAVVDGLARNGRLQEARGLLLENAVRAQVVWKALLSGCVKHGHAEMAKRIHQDIESMFVSNTCHQIDDSESGKAALVSFLRAQRE